MTDFAIATATGADSAALVASCAVQLRGSAGHTLGFVYATDALSGDFPGIVGALRQETGIASWIGTVGVGICSQGEEIFGTPAIAAMTCGFAPGAFTTISANKPADLGAQLRSDAVLGIVHADPRNRDVTEIVAGFASRQQAYLVGGLTSGEGSYPQAAGANVIDGGVSGVLLGGRGLQVGVGLTQGCSPVGPAHEITECDGQIVTTLGGRRAFDVLREDAGAGNDDDPRRWLANMHVALPVPGSDKADYVVRNLVGLDIDAGVIAIGDHVERGDRLLFVRRDRTSAARDMQRMLADVKARAKAPKAGLYFSCLARGPNLFSEPNHELHAIREALGDIPVVGFFGNGEIAHDRVYGYTGVLTVFS